MYTFLLCGVIQNINFIKDEENSSFSFVRQSDDKAYIGRLFYFVLLRRKISPLVEIRRHMEGIIMNYDVKSIFTQANNFLAASNALNEKLSETDDIGTYIGPIITNTAFTIELYIKCIYMIEKRQPVQGHFLDKLYRKLSKESRDIIEAIYDMLVPQSQTIMMLKQQVPDMKIDLDSVLKEMSGAFVKWRYSYEGNLTGFPASGPVIDALRGRIKILKPEWFE